ncbi:putative yippee-like protein [Naematelia encephala]|uniref:Protein yippee-like n=1 Tax=Naematelia encephala TaxID=71784 RepID=A0A1Y2BIQ4_9TREE|nr:putative yippee-like protein [Naematelia encephala]
MGRTFRIYLAGESVFLCRQCGNHLAVGESVLSKAFTGQHGRAILIQHAVNVYTGEAEEREMRTGKHVVRDVFCQVCHSVLGWKYDLAYEPEQKYKEGKFILERELITEKMENKRDLQSDRPRIDEVPVRELMARV